MPKKQQKTNPKELAEHVKKTQEHLIPDEQIYGRVPVKDIIDVLEVPYPTGMIHYLDFKYPGKEDGTSVMDFVENKLSKIKPFKSLQDIGFNLSEAKDSPELALEVVQKVFSVGTVGVNINMTQEHLADQQKLWENHGVDVPAMQNSVILNEFAQSICKHVLNRMGSLALQNLPTYRGIPQKIWAWTLRLFKKTYRPVRRIKSVEHLIHHMLSETGMILKQSRRGPGNFVVLNALLASILEGSAQYAFSPMSMSQMDATGDKQESSLPYPMGLMYQVGTIAGLRVYVDPNQRWTDTTMIVGRHGNDPGTEGQIMLMYLKDGTSIDKEPSEFGGTSAPTLMSRTRYALVDTPVSHLYYRMSKIKYTGKI